MHGADPTQVLLGQVAITDLPLPFGIPAQTYLCMTYQHQIRPIGARTPWGLGRYAPLSSPTPFFFLWPSVLASSGIYSTISALWLGRDTALDHGTSANQRCPAWSHTCSRGSTCVSMHACRSVLLPLKNACTRAIPPPPTPCRMGQ